MAKATAGANVGQQFFRCPRGFLNEVFSTGVDGFNDIVHGAVGGDHDDRHLGHAFFDLGKQFKAALAGQIQVEQQQVEALLDPAFAAPRHRHEAMVTE